MKRLLYFMIVAGVVFGTAVFVSGQRAEMAGERAGSFGDRKADEPDEVENPIFSANVIGETSYPFTTASGIALEDMTGSVELLGAGLDDTASEVTPIGFSFIFDGVVHNEFSCNANGLCRLGSTRISTAFSNSLASTTNAPKIAPLWDDLCTGSDGSVHYKVVGTEGSRRLVVEFKNMMMVRVSGCANPGDGTFQLWLHEGTGVVQFVYGNIAEQTSSSIGFQSGVSTNFVSVTSSTDTASYSTANNSNTGTFSTGKSYIFTPNAATAPTGVTASNVTAVSMDIGWTDASTNELGFIVERSTSGGEYETIAELAADTTTFSDSGLTPSTSYSYRVTAFTEGGAATSNVISQLTNAAGVRVANPIVSDWHNTATWEGGILPTPSDIVVIPLGADISLNTNVSIYGLQVGEPTNPSAVVAEPVGNPKITRLRFDGNAPRTLDVATDIIINSDAMINSQDSPIDTNELRVGGSISVVSGSLVMGATGRGGVILVLTSDKPGLLSGGGLVQVYKVVMQKAEGVAFKIAFGGAFGHASLEDTYLTLVSGIFDITTTGVFPVAARTFATAAYNIPETAGFKLSDPDYTVLGQNGSATVDGSLEITNGTFNVGTSSGNSIGFRTGSTINVSGGTVDVAGRWGVSSSTQAINYEQTGGDITVQTVGNSSTTLAGFDMGTGATSVIDILGGTITVQNASTAATPIDYRMQGGATGTQTVHGATVYFGNANTSSAQNFGVRGVLPNVVVTNLGGGHTVTYGTITRWNPISRNIDIHPGSTFDFGNGVFLMNGETLTNNGTIKHTGSASRFIWFLADEPQTYTGSGNSDGILTSWEAQNGNIVMDPSVQNVVVRRVIIFAGNIINASKLTIGNGDSTVNNIQIGNTTTPTQAGVFDSAPTFNLGTGGQSISYLRGGGSHVTGPEVNPSRVLVNLTHDNVDKTGDTLTIAGGDLTVGGTLNLTNGAVITGANTLYGNGTVTRDSGYVDGKFGREFAAPGSFTFHVGEAGSYSPVLANVTAVNGTSTLVAEANDGTMAGMNSSTSLSRHWEIVETGDITADLSFSYLDEDVNGNEADYRVYSSGGSGLTNHCEAAPCGTPDSNIAGPAVGITEFSLWSAGEVQSTTSEPAVIGGRVLSANGSPVRGAVMVLTGGGLTEPVVRHTSSFGYFRFNGILTGATYTLTVDGTKYSFSPDSMVINHTGDVTDIVFTGTD